MTDNSAPTYVAQLILALPGQDDTATIIVTLLPDDTIPVQGQKKALADCTLRELRTFANTLEGEVWETYEAITLSDLTKDNDLTLTVTLLDNEGKAADKLDDWGSTFIVLPAEKTAPKPQPAKPVKAPAKAEKSTSPKSPKEQTPKPASEVPAPEAKPVSETEKPHTEIKSATPEATPVATQPAPAAKTNDVTEVAASISFPPAVNKEALEEARPKETERPHVPATIKPSEARVRVAGKRLVSGAATWAAVDILMDEPALRAMQAHALSSLDREVAGVMVGPRPEKQPDGRYLVRVIDSIAAKYTVMQGASVTYTADSWRYLNDTLGERYPDETGVMVGWYHTHPGFGIFLSGMDQFIHQNFFTQIWHTAYVLDPRARTSGFFCWSRDKSRVNRYDFVWPDWAEGSW